MRKTRLGQTIKGLFYTLRTKRILLCMIIAYISILLVILLFNMGIYFYLKPILIQEKVDNTTNYLSYISQQTDAQLIDVEDNMHRFLDILSDIRYEDYSENVNQQIQLIRDLINMMNYCPIIEQAAIYDPDSSVVITNEGTTNKEALINKIQENSSLLPEEIRDSIDINQNFDYFPAKSEQNSLIVFYSGISYSNARHFKIIVFVDSIQLKSMLTNSMVEEYAKTYIVNQDFDTILSMEGDSFDRNLMKENQKYNGQTMVMRESQFQDWIYMSVLDDKRIVQNISFMRNTFLILVSLMLGACIAIAVRFSKQYYRPISNIIDNYMLTLNSGKTEFEAISETMEFLKEEKNQLKEKEILSGILRSGFYEENFDFLFPYYLFRVVIAQGNTSHIDEKNITDMFRNENEIVCKVVYNQYNGCTLILNSNDLSDHQTMSLLLRIQKLFYEKHNVFIAFGVSGICNQIMDLHEGYQDATQAFEYGDSSQEACIYIKRDLTEANQSIYMPIEFEQNMTELVYVRNYDGIRKLIEDVFRQNQGIPNVYLRSVVVSMSNAYESIAKKLGNTSMLSGDIINHEWRVPVIKEHLIAAFTGLEGNMLKENRVEAVKNYVTMYVAENYSDPSVSLETIADELQLSASYVSTLFKKATGTAVSQYLLQYRIEVAKEMLCDSKEKISVISEKAGFGTYNNFVRMFKKKVGVSPSQYRTMKHMERNDHKDDNEI